MATSNTYTYKASSDKKYADSPVTPADRIAVGVTDKMNRKLHYSLNMDIGKGGYSQNTSKYFDRLYTIYPDHELTSVCQYVFFVRPDLNILDSSGNLVNMSAERTDPNSSPHKDEFMKYMNKKYPYLLRNLSGDQLGDHDFMPILVGRTESLSLSDYSLKEYKITQPYSEFNLPYAHTAYASQTGGQFEVTFREDDELRIHKLFSTWVYYINQVSMNMFAPRFDYIKNDIIDYATSIYCITCKPDATTIIHWFKYTGCIPTSAPHSDMSFNLRGGANNKITIPFSYFKASDPFDPLVLVDFNKNSHIINTEDTTKYMPFYSDETVGGIGLKTKDGYKVVGAAPAVLGTGNGLSGQPFICKTGTGSNIQYELRWKQLEGVAP